MSIFKDTFRRYVRDQISVREELINIGNTDGFTTKTNRNSSNKVVLNLGKSNEKEITLDAGAFYNYTLNKQCIIRMTSMVDYVENVNLEVGGLEGAQSFNALKGASLSQNFILEGGVLSDFARIRDGKREVRRVTTPRDSFPKPGQRTNLGYGDLAIGADASSDGYGIVPMPGIIDANIRTKSAYGSLREAKVNFSCHNRRQLEVLEMLYMRPGYMVVLEWGWTPYINNNGSIVNETRLLEDITDGKIYTNDITQEEVFSSINKLKEYHQGNYDGFLGFVKNFGFQAREDGGFDCYTELISIGEVLESLKIPNISTTNPKSYIFGSAEGDIGGNVNVESTTTTFNGASLGYTRPGTATTVTDQNTFNEALEAGIFPETNGLEGLVQALSNYAIFNDFTRRNERFSTSTEYEEQALNKIFEFNDRKAAEAAAEEGDKSLLTQRSRARQLAGIADSQERYSQKTLTSYLKDLVRFQSANLEEYLIKILELNDKADLRNYIIPIGGNTYSYTPSGQKISSATTSYNTQPYIRWDAFCALINEHLIPKDENILNPIKIVSDRLYDTDSPIENISKLDPLLFVPISEYVNTQNNPLLDFSCDPNICILPLQFETNPLKDQGDQIDALAIEKSLGYIPDTSVFPVNYTIGTFNKERSVYYNNQEITLSNPPLLTSTDQVRRIGSIFLNINMLVNIAEQNSDTDGYTLGKFINDIWGEVNKVCPNHNFVLTDDKESNTTYIIDLPVDNSEVPLDLHEFIPFSNKNTLRKFEYTSNVPKALSATIAIQSQDPRSIEDIDGVTFAAFNRSIKNRLLSKDTTSNWDKTKNAIKSNRSSLLTRQNELGTNLKVYFASFFRNLRATANDKDTIGTGNIVGTLKEYQKNAAYLSNTITKVGTFNSVIPLEFSATLDGISGIVIGNMFKVQKDRLPKAYANANIGFIVFNEDQQINGQDWTTNISGKMTILPDKAKPIITGTTNIIYTEEDILEEVSQISEDSTTESLPEGQAEITDIKNAVDGEIIYLKKLKDPEIKTVDGQELPVTIEGITYGKNICLSFVRATPEIDNETQFSYTDNIIGAFNSWDNGGIPLGVVKPEGIRVAEFTEEKKVALKPSAYNTYFDNADTLLQTGKELTFIYRDKIKVEKDGEQIEYYQYKGSINVDSPTIDALTGESIIFGQDQIVHIKVSDCTRTDSVWYNIQFSASASEAFLGDHVRFEENIRTKGASGGQLLTQNFSFERLGVGLDTYSINNDCWMRYDVLAASRESAIQASIAQSTEVTNNAFVIETYKGVEIYKDPATDSYATVVDIIVDGEVDVQAGDSFSSINDLKTIIDESFE